jgi:formyl-CoA transferase
MGTMITAPLAAMMLADLGASVVKIEHPNGGDPFRRTAGGDYGPNYVAYNHSKRSLKLDLTQADGREILGRLLRDADILVENYRPGVLHKLGFGPAALASINPRLIHCSITGFGTTGPYSTRPSYDTVGIALSGIASLMLEPDRPELVGPTIADNVTGMYACSGMLAALHARDRTGEGQRVEINMLESSISMIPDPIAYYTQSDTVYRPTSRVASSHCYAFKCSDEKLISVHLSVPEKFWLNCLEALDANETLGQDERFKTRRGRITHYPALYAGMSALVATKPRAYWEQRFARYDVPFAPVLEIPDVFDDPQVRHLEVFQKVDHPTEGPVTIIRPPVSINGSRPDVGAPPTAGQDSTDILAELGYSNEHIDAMRTNHVI